MLLAISANDVAFVSVVVTGVTAIVGPLITWQIAKGGRKHEREVDLSRRNYDARSKVYVETLIWTLVLRRQLTAIMDGEKPPARPEYNDPELLFSELSAFGSKNVVDTANRFYASYLNAWVALNAATTDAARKAVGVGLSQQLGTELQNMVRDELTK